jgi:hypothetical protein
MDLETFGAFRSNAQRSSVGSAAALQQIVTIGTKSTIKSTPTKTTRVPYHSYKPLQVQELIDLVIEEGFSARQEGLSVGIVVRTTQHYVRYIYIYKDNGEKRLPDAKKASRLGGNDRKLEPKHTDFLCQYYDNNAAAVL